MKKSILLVVAVAGLALVSCKKEYHCECTTTDSSGTIPTVSTETIIKDTKSKAEEACHGLDQSVGTLSTECEIH